MAEPLGRLEKPEAEGFMGKRKLFLVPLVFFGEKAPPEYVEKCNLYWEQAAEHLANLESKIGKVNHVFHESVAAAGEEGLKAIERFNSGSGRLAREKCQHGAVLEATEDKEIVEESLDWERFVLMGFISQRVAEKVSQFYIEAVRQRYEHIARRIDEVLKNNEVGVLFIREGHMVQFPGDIEVFLVAPPALDEIHRWQREQVKKEKSEKPADERH